MRFAGDASTSAPEGTRRESLIEIVIDRMPNADARKSLAEELDRVYRDVRVAVDDWIAMRGKLGSAVLAYRTNPPPLPRAEIAEAIAFLDWLADDNFTFLGVRVYTYPRGDAAANPVDGSGLGILRDPDVQVMKRGSQLLSVIARDPRIPCTSSGAHHRQGERPLARPSPRPSRLYRRQIVFRRRQARRGNAAGRPLLIERLYCFTDRHSLPAAEDR